LGLQPLDEKIIWWIVGSPSLNQRPIRESRLVSRHVVNREASGFKILSKQGRTGSGDHPGPGIILAFARVALVIVFGNSNHTARDEHPVAVRENSRPIAFGNIHQGVRNGDAECAVVGVGKATFKRPVNAAIEVFEAGEPVRAAAQVEFHETPLLDSESQTSSRFRAPTLLPSLPPGVFSKDRLTSSCLSSVWIGLRICGQVMVPTNRLVG